MKRFLSLLIVLALYASMAACQSDVPYETDPVTEPAVQHQPSQTETEQTQPATTEPTTAPTIPVQQPYPHPLTAISMPLMEDTEIADDGKSIFIYSFQTLNLVLPDPSAANSITVDFLNHTDFSGSAAENVYRAALGAYQGQEDWNPYFYRNLYKPTRLDQSILSLYGEKTYYDGAPHSNLVAQSLTYDLVHGTRLTLRQLLVPNFDSAALCRLICENFNSKDAEFFYPDYDVVIEDMFSTNIPMEDWYLTDDGLCFFFNPGEIAPYSEEIPVSLIPYSELNGLIQDAFFPEETVEFHGTPVFEAVTEDMLADFDQIIEVVEDTDAVRYCFRVNGTIQNVRFYLSGSDGIGDSETDAIVFAAQALTDGNAVLLQCSEEWIGRLWVAYWSAGQEYHIYLTQLKA